MPVTIKVNGVANSLVHKGSNHISMATIPDVCKTPTPGGPVPIPYPNISQSTTLAKGTTTVKADGGMMIAIKGSEFSMSNGDEAGSIGGVKSSTFIKESTWILYSFDVKMDGENACRLSDKKFQNHENTVDLGGAIGPPIPIAEFEAILEDCAKKAEDSINDWRKDKPPLSKETCKEEIEFRGEKMERSKALGIKKGEEAEKCVAEKMAEQGKSNEVSIQQPYQGSAGNKSLRTDGPPNAKYNPSGSQVPDVVLHEPGKPVDIRGVYDFKFPCPPSSEPYQWFTKRGQPTQGERYFSAFGKKPNIVTPGSGVSCPPLRNPAFR